MEGFIGQVMLVGFNFAPRNWFFCHGQLLAIAQFSPLFSILGDTYGGDGRTTFALPDLRGRVIVGAGSGPGLSPYTLGQKGGQETVTLTTDQIPSHTHSLFASSETGISTQPENSLISNSKLEIDRGTSRDAKSFQSATNLVAMHGNTIANQGGGQPINNMQPSLALNYVICHQGVFPSPG